MGWTQLSPLFDEVIDAIINPGNSMIVQVEKIVEAFENNDWESPEKSRFYNHPFVIAAFSRLHPDPVKEDLTRQKQLPLFG